MMDCVKVFAPATMANIGPGFDVLGLAVTGDGDIVEARKIDTPGVIIEAISGDGGRLPLAAAENTAGVAATEALKLAGSSTGVALKLYKGLPLGRGLGSSAASAAAAGWAVAILHDIADKLIFLPACLAAEATVSGYHADNVAPSLLGGLVLINGYHPLKVDTLPVPADLWIVLVTPDHEVSTAEARAVIPQMIPLEKAVANAGYLGAMVAASFKGDVVDFGRAIVDQIIEPARAHLIPGFLEVKEAALKAGGLGCSISGAGPTVFAISNSREIGQRIGYAMQRAFQGAGVSSVVNVASVDIQGARQI